MPVLFFSVVSSEEEGSMASGYFWHTSRRELEDVFTGQNFSNFQREN